MSLETPFKQLISLLRPLMKGSRSLGEFTAQLVDMGLNPSAADGKEKSALGIRRRSTWKSYANGSLALSKTVASELAGRWDHFRFAKNMIDAYDEDALNNLAASLHEFDSRINKSNVAEGIGTLLYEIFAAAAEHPVADAAKRLTPIRRAEVTGAPYYDHKRNRLYLGDDSVRAPDRAGEPPEEIRPEELVYVNALLHAYCEHCDLHGGSPGILDIPERDRKHFIMQRRAFFDAEWLKDTSWNCFTDDGELLFQRFLEEIYQGVYETNIDDYPSQRKRLFATLTQAVNTRLNEIALDQVAGLIDALCRKGACHELVNQHQLSWEG